MGEVPQATTSLKHWENQKQRIERKKQNAIAEKKKTRNEKEKKCKRQMKKRTGGKSQNKWEI